MVNGQKVWTSLAQHSDWAILLARTDPESKGRVGLSCFVVDMHSPGVDVLFLLGFFVIFLVPAVMLFSKQD